MLKIETLAQSRFRSVSFEVEPPEGTMFVTVIESDDRKPIGIDIHVGKAGSIVRAWAHSMARMVCLAFDNGASVEDVIEQLSMQTSDKAGRASDIVIRSGPEGIAYALMSHKRDRVGFMRAQAGIGDDDSTERRGRSGRMAN